MVNDKYDGKDYGNFHIYIKEINTNKSYEIPITKVEISEEDLRVKSAKFSSYVEIDLSANMYYVDIKYWNEKIYSGMILNMEYDEKTGIYSYQSLGHQRWLTSKTWFVFNPASKTKNLYEALKEFVKKIKSNTSIKSVSLLNKKEYEMYPNLLSAYQNRDGKKSSAKSLKKNKNNNDKINDYGWSVKDGLFYEDKTYYEILMSIISKSLYAIDCYVDENNVLRFDKIDLNDWKKPNTVKFVLGDLKNYTFKSDATNIITGIHIKETDIYKEHKITEPKFYSSKDMIGEDLTLIYGKMETFGKGETIKTTQTKTTNTNTESTEETPQTEEKEVANVVANERNARSEITKSLRDLMSFDIEINGYYPQIHTNMFIWFEVPKKHTLANYQKFMARIDQTTTRGGKYVLNRFYVEKISTTYDDKGIVSKITLNPFASDMSSYYKIYEDAIKAYEEANCSSGDGSSSSSSSSTTSTGNTTGGKGSRSGKPNTPQQAKVATPPSDCGTITVTGYPTTAGSTGGNSPYKYKKYTKTWANYCPVCNRSGTLVDNPKGVPDGEITCSQSKGGCDADWDCVTGKNKAGSCPNPGCKYDYVYLIDANGNRNSKGNISDTVGGSTGASNGASASTGSSSSCASGTSASGSYSTDAIVSQLADKLTNAKDEQQICKDLQTGFRKSVRYKCWAGFCKEPKEVLTIKRANCGDGTRTQLTMCAYKGVNQSKLKYVHIQGHYYAEYNGIAMDWCGGGRWNHHWGSGGLIDKSVFPKLPNANGCYGTQGCGKGGLELEIEEEIYSYNDIQNYQTYLINTLNEIDGLPILQDFNYLDYNKFNELGYKSHNQYLKENKDLEIIDFDDIDKYIRRCR